MTGAFLAVGGATLALGLCIIATYEAYALYTGSVPPITSIIRENISAHPHAACSIFGVAGVLIGWLIGHLGKY